MADRKKITLDIEITADDLKRAIKDVKEFKKELEKVDEVTRGFNELIKSIKGLETEFGRINSAIDKVFSSALANLGHFKRRIEEIKKEAKSGEITRAEAVSKIAETMGTYGKKLAEAKSSLAGIGREYSESIDAVSKIHNVLSQIPTKKAIENLDTLRQLFGELRGAIPTGGAGMPQLINILDRVQKSIGFYSRETERIRDMVTGGAVSPVEAMGRIEAIFSRLSNLERVVNFTRVFGENFQKAFKHAEGLRTSIEDITKKIGFGTTFEPFIQQIDRASSIVANVFRKIPKDVSISSEKMVEGIEKAMGYMGKPSVRKQLEALLALPQTAREALTTRYGERFGGFLYEKAIDITKAREAVKLADEWLKANKKIADPALVTAVERWRIQQDLLAHGLRAGEISIRNFSLSAKILKEDIKDLIFWQARWYGTKFVLFLPIETLSSIINQFKEYSHQLKVTQAVTDMTDKELKELDGTIKNLSTVTAHSHTELAEAATLLAKGGLAGEQLNKALEMTAKLAVSTKSNIRTVSDVLISFVAAWNLSAEETERVTNALMVAVNKAKLDVADVSTALNYLAGVAKATSTPLEDLLAIIAGLSQVAKPSTLATGLRTFMAEIMEGADRVKALLDRTGIGYERALGMLKSGDLLQLINLLAQSGIKIEEIFQGLLVRGGTSLATLRAVLPLINEIRQSMGDLTAVDRAAKTATSDFDSEMKKLGNSIKNLVFPVLEGLSHVLIPIINGFTGIASAMREFWYIAVFALIPSLPKLISLLKSLYEILKGLAVLRTLGALGVGPWGLIGTIIAGGAIGLSFLLHREQKRREEEEKGMPIGDVILKRTEELNKLKAIREELAKGGSVEMLPIEELDMQIQKLEEDIERLKKKIVSVSKGVQGEASEIAERASETLSRISTSFNRSMTLIERGLREKQQELRSIVEENMVEIEKADRLGLKSYEELQLQRLAIQRGTLLKEKEEISKALDRLQKEYKKTISEIRKSYAPEDEKRRREEEITEAYEIRKSELLRGRRAIDIEIKKQETETWLNILQYRLDAEKKAATAINTWRIEELRDYQELQQKMREAFFVRLSAETTAAKGILQFKLDSLDKEYQARREMREKELRMAELELEYVIKEDESAYIQRKKIMDDFLRKSYQDYLWYIESIDRLYAESVSREIEARREQLNEEIKMLETARSIYEINLDRRINIQRRLVDLGLGSSKELYELERRRILETSRMEEEILLKRFEEEKEAYRGRIVSAPSEEEKRRLIEGWELLIKEQEERRVRLRQETLKQLEELELAYLDNISKAYEEGGFLYALRRALFFATKEFRNEGENIKSIGEDIANALSRGFDDFFDYTSKGFLNWRNFVTNVLNDIYRSLVRALVIRPFVGAIGNLGNVISMSINSFINSRFLATAAYSPPPAHTGGLVRLHTGGEVVAVLQEGEYVVSRKGVEFLDKINRGVEPFGRGDVKVNVVVNNNTGTPMTARQSVEKRGLQETIVTIWLDAFERNFGGLKDILGR